MDTGGSHWLPHWELLLAGKHWCRTKWSWNLSSSSLAPRPGPAPENVDASNGRLQVMPLAGWGHLAPPTRRQVIGCIKFFWAHSSLWPWLALPTGGPQDPVSPTSDLVLQGAFSGFWVSLTHEGANTRGEKTTVRQPVKPGCPQQARPCPGISWTSALTTSRPTQALGYPKPDHVPNCDRNQHLLPSSLTADLGSLGPATRLQGCFTCR